MISARRAAHVLHRGVEQLGKRLKTWAVLVNQRAALVGGSAFVVTLYSPYLWASPIPRFGMQRSPEMVASAWLPLARPLLLPVVPQNGPELPQRLGLLLGLELDLGRLEVILFDIVDPTVGVQLVALVLGPFL